MLKQFYFKFYSSFKKKGTLCIQIRAANQILTDQYFSGSINMCHQNLNEIRWRTHKEGDFLS